VTTAASAGATTAGTTTNTNMTGCKRYTNSNGTYVNGTVIGKNKVYSLKQGDMIDLFVPKSKNAKEQRLTYSFHPR
jgi:FHA domain